MWIIRSMDNNLHTVGYYIPPTDSRRNPDYRWHAHRDFTNMYDAERFIHWLNGGNSLEAFKETA